MRANNNHFDATITKTRERCNSLGLEPQDTQSTEQRTVDAQEKFRIDVYSVNLDTIIVDLTSQTRFNDTTVGILKAFDCISHTTFIDKHEDVPAASIKATTNFVQLLF